jgi:predicted ester cyclase
VLDDDLILCADDYVIVRTTLKSLDTTGVAGNAPTGKPFAVTATDIYRFENGKVVERWGNSDVAGIYMQLGFKVVPK